jgi:hypothetical protein
MRRVVPSQVREYLQAVFGDKTRPEWNVVKEDSPKLAGLLTICEGLPDELLTGADYVKYMAALTTIQHQLEAWNYKVDPNLPQLPHVFGTNPLSIINDFLEQCPDEFPSPSTTALAFVADPQLRDSIRLDISAANRDLENHEYKGATVLAGSATEALLLWAIIENESRYSGVIQKAAADALKANRLSKPPEGDPEKWGLSELIEVALSLRLIEDNTAKQARLSKDFRNLIHPGKAKRLQTSCDRGSAFAAMAAVELVAPLNSAPEARQRSWRNDDSGLQSTCRLVMEGADSRDVVG